MVRGENPFPDKFKSYEDLINDSSAVSIAAVDGLTESVHMHELCNFQFTSGLFPFSSHVLPHH